MSEYSTRLEEDSLPLVEAEALLGTAVIASEKGKDAIKADGAEAEESEGTGPEFLRATEAFPTALHDIIMPRVLLMRWVRRDPEGGVSWRGLSKQQEQHERVFEVGVVAAGGAAVGSAESSTLAMRLSQA